MTAHPAKVKYLLHCPGCWAVLDRWSWRLAPVGVKRLDGSRSLRRVAAGGGRGRSFDGVDPGDGMARFIRYRCGPCGVETVWDAVGIEAAMRVARDTGALDISWAAAHYSWSDAGTGAPTRWQDFQPARWPGGLGVVYRG